MVPFRVKVLLICAAFHGLLNAAADGLQCKEGEKVKRGKRLQPRCEACGPGRYQPEPNTIQSCPPCTVCNEEAGSETKFQCIQTRDTTCQCRKGFISRENNSATCKCDVGSGLSTKATGVIPECRECEDGFFTAQIDTTCVKWKQCEKSGVKDPGTKTSDAVCNDESDRGSLPWMSTTPSTHPTLTTPPPNSIQTQRLVSFKPALTTNSSILQGSDYGKEILIVGLVLLLILPVVTYTLVIKPCIDNKKQIFRTAPDSIYGKPVEESGESSLSSLVKSSSGEQMI